jgi:hypothetical protein
MEDIRNYTTRGVKVVLMRHCIRGLILFNRPNGRSIKPISTNKNILTKYKNYA